MDLGVVGGVLFFAIGVPLMVRQAIMVWTGDDRFRCVHTKPPNLPFSASIWRNMVHAMPVLAVDIVLFAASAAVAAIANGPATVVLAACWFMSSLLAGVVFLLNWPSSIVPPQCRGERGWIRELLDQRRQLR